MHAIHHDVEGLREICEVRVGLVSQNSNTRGITDDGAIVLMPKPGKCGSWLAKLPKGLSSPVSRRPEATWSNAEMRERQLEER